MIWWSPNIGPVTGNFAYSPLKRPEFTTSRLPRGYTWVDAISKVHNPQLTGGQYPLHTVLDLVSAITHVNLVHITHQLHYATVILLPSNGRFFDSLGLIITEMGSRFYLEMLLRFSETIFDFCPEIRFLIHRVPCN